ncbi:hypothetical protein DFH11DRAFT_1649893, partial [Phellopilus nigrolimitatus]
MGCPAARGCMAVCLLWRRCYCCVHAIGMLEGHRCRGLAVRRRRYGRIGPRVQVLRGQERRGRRRRRQGRHELLHVRRLVEEFELLCVVMVEVRDPVWVRAAIFGARERRQGRQVDRRKLHLGVKSRRRPIRRHIGLLQLLECVLEVGGVEALAARLGARLDALVDERALGVVLEVLCRVQVGGR